MNKIDKGKIIYLASKYADKGYSYETIKYGDDLYYLSSKERDDILDQIWQYIKEYQDYGRIPLYEHTCDFCGSRDKFTECYPYTKQNYIFIIKK